MRRWAHEQLQGGGAEAAVATAGLRAAVYIFRFAPGHVSPPQNSPPGWLPQINQDCFACRSSGGGGRGRGGAETRFISHTSGQSLQGVRSGLPPFVHSNQFSLPALLPAIDVIGVPRSLREVAVSAMLARIRSGSSTGSLERQSAMLVCS